MPDGVTTRAQFSQALKRTLKAVYHRLPGKRWVFSLIRGVGLPRWLYRYLTFVGPFEVRVGDVGVQMWHHGYQLENDLFWCNGYEAQSLNLWVRLCRISTRIFDVGANTGLFALLAQQANPSAQVVAFEPVPRIFQRLTQNIVLNNFRICCEQLALSNQSGVAEIFDLPFEHSYGASLCKKWSEDLSRQGASVPVLTTMDYCASRSIGVPDLMKIDVEYHEIEVLEGLGDLLAQHQPTLLVEVLDDAIGARLEAMMKPLDYRFFAVDERSGPTLVQHVTAQHDGRNVLFCSTATARSVGLL